MNDNEINELQSRSITSQNKSMQLTNKEDDDLIHNQDQIS